MNSIRSAAFLFSLAALVPLAPAGAATCPNSGLRIVPVAFQTAKGRFVYKVEVAATAEEQACGMMFRDRMAPGTGMAFPMQPPRATGFWMENTPLPLDMIFIDAQGEVVDLITRTAPLSETYLPARRPARYVIEINAGEAEAAGLAPGARLRLPANFPAFSP